jgi:hypothetical protein
MWLYYDSLRFFFSFAASCINFETEIATTYLPLVRYWNVLIGTCVILSVVNLYLFTIQSCEETLRYTLF